MTTTLRRATLALSTTLALAAAVPATAGATAVPCRSIGHGKYDCSFYPAGDGIHGGAPVLNSSGTRIGYLNQGTNYVYCQDTGAEVYQGKNRNHWWAYTTANDHRKGWVNALWAHGGTNDAKYGHVPHCAAGHTRPVQSFTRPPDPANPDPWKGQTLGVDYVSMGDSYASGQGTGDPYYNDTCKRTTRAYAFKLASPFDHLTGLRLAARQVACSGYTTSQVAAHQLSALSKKTDLVTLSVGGDDLKFSSIVQQCIKAACESQIHSAERKAKAVLPGRLKKLYAQVRGRVRADTRIIVVGYPRLFPDDPTKESFSCRNFKFTRISVTEQRDANHFAATLNRVIGGTALSAGDLYENTYVLFHNHDACAHDDYLNGIVPSHPTRDSFHPTSAGHRAWAGAIAELAR